MQPTPGESPLTDEHDGLWPKGAGLPGHECVQMAKSIKQRSVPRFREYVDPGRNCDRAFGFLIRLSQQRNVNLRVLAEWIVTHRDQSLSELDL